MSHRHDFGNIRRLAETHSKKTMRSGCRDDARRAARSIKTAQGLVSWLKSRVDVVERARLGGELHKSELFLTQGLRQVVGLERESKRKEITTRSAGARPLWAQVCMTRTNYWAFPSRYQTSGIYDGLHIIIHNVYG